MAWLDEAKYKQFACSGNARISSDIAEKQLVIGYAGKLKTQSI